MKKIMSYVETEYYNCPKDPFTGNLRIMEEWRPLVYRDVKEGLYLISSLGNILSLVTGKYKAQFLGYGYPHVSLQTEQGTTKVYKVAILVANTFLVNPCPEYYNMVNHINTIRDDSAKYNLDFTDASGNLQHRIDFYNMYPFMIPPTEEELKTGPDNKWATKTSGERNGMVSWTAEQVHIMCKAISEGYDYKYALELAGIEYTVNNRKNLSKIIKGDRWKDIACQYTFPEGRAKRSPNINR